MPTLHRDTRSGLTDRGSPAFLDSQLAATASLDEIAKAVAGGWEDVRKLVVGLLTPDRIEELRSHIENSLGWADLRHGAASGFLQESAVRILRSPFGRDLARKVLSERTGEEIGRVTESIGVDCCLAVGTYHDAALGLAKMIPASDTLGETFAILEEHHLDRVMWEWRPHQPLTDAELLSICKQSKCKIDPDTKREFSLLVEANATDDPAVHMDCFWRRVHLHLLPVAVRCSAIRKAILKERPLTRDQLAFVQQGVRGATFSLGWHMTEGGRGKYELFVHPVPRASRSLTDDGDADADHDLEPADREHNGIVSGLRASICFELARQLEEFFSKRGPQAIVTCHAPSCGKRFYTAKSHQVTCSSPVGKIMRSDCKREWQQYRYWLKDKLHRDPDEAWDKAKLQAQFLKGFHSRPRRS